MKREAKKAVNKTQGEALDSLFQDQGHEKRERNVWTSTIESDGEAIILINCSTHTTRINLDMYVHDRSACKIRLKKVQDNKKNMSTKPMLPIVSP